MPENTLLGTDETPIVPPTSDEKTLALLSHVLTFIFPLVAPLVIYLIKKDDSEFVRHHSRESLNFQITLVIVCIILVLTLVGILLLWIVGIIDLILVVIATIRAAEGKLYKYPFSIRLIK